MMIQKRQTSRQGITDHRKYIRIGSKHQGDYIEKTNILYVEACESYSWLYLKNGSRILSCKTIGFYEALFSTENFIRIHRSYLINLSYLKLYEPKYRIIHLKGEIVLPVSHRKNRLISKMISNKETNTPFKIAV
ncbi:LytTR family transcriptional regulator DNA-binding domain-containing protein [uncultured Kordia sp.]|uniref:LytR/AlgR family response regulator transcription factor n=1 Tax=uncultured Kordia sp. TaxID=507699 RepID=UPI00262E464F|nr:LytTR family transcriptional regulator DNA-binding domain-containing protein [uncultured Kordia sp.]